jgi:uncharacterized protein (TIGR01244 family)
MPCTDRRGGQLVVQPKQVTDQFFVTVQPSKADIRRFAQHGYRTVINNRPDDEEPGQLSAAEGKAEAKQAGMAYVHLPVKTGAITRSDVDAFQRALRESPQPVVAHCRTGTRSYLLWAADQAIRGERDVADMMKQAAAAGYDLSSLPGLLSRLGEPKTSSSS